jgi:hypothetical protein
MITVESRLLKLRRADTCCVCRILLRAGSWAGWDPQSKAVTCMDCAETAAQHTAPEIRPPELDRGRAGASVAREYERRKHNREARTRQRHPWIGGLLLGLRGTPQHEAAFRSGHRGEREVAASLERVAARGSAVVLHDRRMPGGYGNIDHLAIAPAGVFVIDAKNIKGKVRVAGSLFGAGKLRISGRDQTKLIDGLERQVNAVSHVLGAHGCADVPVQGVLCFTKADLPLFGAQKMRGHLLLSRRGVARRLSGGGRLSAASIEDLARMLATGLPSA